MKHKNKKHNCECKHHDEEDIAMLLKAALIMRELETKIEVLEHEKKQANTNLRLCESALSEKKREFDALVIERDALNKQISISHDIRQDMAKTCNEFMKRAALWRTAFLAMACSLVTYCVITIFWR